MPRAPHLAPNDMAARAGQVPSLDGLRAVSIALVLLAHLVNDRWFPGGFGVLTFFVISGFLITRLLFAEHKSRGAISLGAFYVRRVIRLYPAVVAYTAIVSAAILIVAPARFDWPEPVSALFYFANYLFVHYNVDHVTVTMPFTHFWSLSIEEQFYIFFPALLLLLRARPASVAAMAAVACAVPLALRSIGAARHPELLDTEYFYLRTEMRIDSIAFGVLVASLCELPRGQALVRWLIRPLSVAIAMLVLIFCFAWRDPYFRETLRYTLLAAVIAVGMSAVVFSARYAPANYILNTAPVVWVGKLSYSLYIWHLATSEAVKHWFAGGPPYLVAALALAACIAMAALSYYALEQPLIGLRRRFGSRTAERPALD
jgi:peptidoglycan/LPS O-acetylase OafA/YrhL